MASNLANLFNNSLSLTQNGQLGAFPATNNSMLNITGVTPAYAAEAGNIPYSTLGTLDSSRLPTSIPAGTTATSGPAPVVQPQTSPLGQAAAAAPAGVSGGAGGGVAGGGAGYDPYAQVRTDALAQLEQDYLATVGGLNDLGSQTRAGGAQALTDLGTARTSAKGQADLLQTNANDQLGLQTAQANTGAESALASANRAYQELGQKNNAYLSAGGISDSSVAQALEQQLGAGTSLAINQIQSNKDGYLKALDTEMTRVKGYVTQQVNDLEGAYNTAVDNVNLELNSALGRINTAKGLAENQKSQARQNILNNVQGTLQQIQVQAANYGDALKAFAQKQTSAINGLSSFAVSIPGSVDFMKSVNDLVASGYNVPAFLKDYGAGQPKPFVTYFTGAKVPLKPEDQGAPQAF